MLSFWNERTYKASFKKTPRYRLSWIHLIDDRLVDMDLCCLVRVWLSIFIFLISASATLFSGELEVVRKDIEKDLSRIRIVPGIDFKSSSQRRGVLLYKHPSLSPFIHFHIAGIHQPSKVDESEAKDFFYSVRPELHLSLGSISASILFLKYFRYSLGIDLFSGGELIKFFEDEVRDRQSRPFSMELFSNLEFQPVSWMRFGIGLEKELIEHRGFHGFTSAGFRPLQILGKAGEIVSAWIDGDLGFADMAHNRYLYGAGAGMGLSHYGIGIYFEWPKVFWDMSFGNGVNYSGLIGKNRRGDLVVGHPDYLTLSLSIQKPF